MKKINEKTAQKGGMMIEALAMLGLIAVVTPTMYKKSAERTLEVEDINTATTMRSVMAAADSYVSANYATLIDSPEAVIPVAPTDLAPYLPYGFKADKLYDYGEPRVNVVKNGNGDNLTAFVTFPAKEDENDGLGKERTVRIATLIGGNGGYVNGNKSAKGIGGIWSISGGSFNDIVGSDTNINSIVIASSDAINNTNAEKDSDKFLYRNKEGDDLWHNTMRTDLYMGGNSDEQDRYGEDPQEQAYSIRNIKSLIVGAENAGAEGDDAGNYGLYMTGENSNAYIQGTLEAASSNLKVTSSSLETAFDHMGTPHFKAYITESANPHLAFGYNHADETYNFVADNTSLVTKTNTMLSTGSAWSTVKIGDIGEDQYLISGNNNKQLSLVNNRIQIFGPDPNEGNTILINLDGKKGLSNSETFDQSINYSDYRYLINGFPVVVDSNARVDGILGAAQLDAQNVRLATLEAGSTNIDDANKWLKVDADGIHGKDPNNKVNIEIYDNDDNKGLIEFSTSNNRGSAPGVDQISEYDAQDKDAEFPAKISYAKMEGTKTSIYSSENIKLKSQSIQLLTGTTTGAGINTYISDSQIKITPDVKKGTTIYEPGNSNTSVVLDKTNFRVTKKEGETEKKVFEVRGNSVSGITKDSGGNEYDVAVHGRAVFTSDLTGGQSDRKYMSVGDKYNTGAMVNIVQNDKTLKNVLTIDGDADAKTSGSYTSKNENNEDVTNSLYDDGTVYIRKGMVEVKPGTPSGLADEDKTAANGYGVVKASRFVANNMKYMVGTDEVDPTKVPQFFSDDEYKNYNGVTDTNGRYDTYMVNPAYTSVMHDIKLTTRGGARLSDILPDFINKGIYITSNTYKDSISELKFKLGTNDDGTKSVKPASGSLEDSGQEIILGNTDSWASPYLGFVPAPQCPPGYNRLITLAPQSFMMAQAGQLQKSKDDQNHPRGGAAYYTKNQVPEDSAFTNYNQMLDGNSNYVSQGFRQVTISNNVDLVKENGSTTNVVTSSGAAEKVQAKTEGVELTTGYYDDTGSYTIEHFTPSAEQHPYFLVSYGDTTPPITIQQSTWLKTNVIPIDNSENAYGIGDDNSGYTIGWAALMGFVYDNASYKSVIEELQGNTTLIEYTNDGNATNVYWNIFPVRRNTLEAYATVYCYFDRNGIMWDSLANKNSEGKPIRTEGWKDPYYGEYIDHYEAMTDSKNNTEKKNIGEKYKERLNDPTLKYDEVW